MSTRESERCYLLHELARLNVDTKQPLKARVYATKCQTGKAHSVEWNLSLC